VSFDRLSLCSFPLRDVVPRISTETGGQPFLIVGIRFDLLDEVYYNADLVDSGQLGSIYHSTRKPRHLMAGMNAGLLGAFGTWFQSLN